jgi:hypothetical protein
MERKSGLSRYWAYVAQSRKCPGQRLLTVKSLVRSRLPEESAWRKVRAIDEAAQAPAGRGLLLPRLTGTSPWPCAGRHRLPDARRTGGQIVTARSGGRRVSGLQLRHGAPAGHEGRPLGISVRRRWRWLAVWRSDLEKWIAEKQVRPAGSGPKASKQKSAAKKPAPRKGRSRK